VPVFSVHPDHTNRSPNLALDVEHLHSGSLLDIVALESVTSGDVSGVCVLLLS